MLKVTIIDDYSETSDKGHSERGQTSQQRTHQLYSSIHTLYKITSERGQPLYKGQTGGPNGVHYSEVPLYSEATLYSVHVERLSSFRR